MKKNSDKPAAAELHRRAEERLKRLSPTNNARGTEAETARLVHELQVHQIELEMQNEELREARARVEALAAATHLIFNVLSIPAVALASSGWAYR